MRSRSSPGLSALLVLWCALLAGCAVPMSIRLEQPDRLRISGTIAKGSAEKFAQRLKPGVRTVVVSSRGGIHDEALAIAEMIHERGLSVEVDGECFSACAQFIFPAGAQRGVLPSGFLAFHAGDAPLKKLLLKEYAKAKLPTEAGAESLAHRVSTTREHFAAMEQRAASHYRAVGMQPTVVDFFTRLTTPRLRQVIISADATAHRADVAPAPCDWWVPDDRGLQALGVPIGNFELPSTAKIARSLNTDVERIYFGPPIDNASDDQLAALCGQVQLGHSGAGPGSSSP